MNIYVLIDFLGALLVGAFLLQQWLKLPVPAHALGAHGAPGRAQWYFHKGKHRGNSEYTVASIRMATRKVGWSIVKPRRTTERLARKMSEAFWRGGI
jgi:hypothetical protein